MNKLGIYCIRDTKAEAYMTPFVMRTNGEAIRAFDDCVQKGGTPVSDHPEDFFLFKCGEFDQETGTIIPCELVSLGSALDFVKEVK